MKNAFFCVDIGGTKTACAIFGEDGEELFIAMALLPLGIDVGTALHYEFPDFTVIE